MPNNTEIEDKKTEINFNNKNILLHSSITFPFNPGGGVGGVGVLCNFRFGLREKLGNLDFPEGGVFCNFGFGLREKLGNLDFPEGGGYSATSDLDLGKNLEIGIFQRGGYSATSDLDLGKNVEIWIFQRGGILQLRIWT